MNKVEHVLGKVERVLVDIEHVQEELNKLNKERDTIMKDNFGMADKEILNTKRLVETILRVIELKEKK